MKRVFVYEYLSGGGLVGGDEATSDELLPQGLAMRNALVTDLLRLRSCEVSVATCDRVPCPPRAAQAVAPRAGEPPLAFVARQAAVHDLTWVVAPETGGLLAAFRDAVGPCGWLGCDAAAIRLASSKRATLQRLADHGVPTPLAFAGMPGVTRWVVKPDDGAGAVASRVHTSEPAARSDAARRPLSDGDVVIEPWVDGEPLSLSLQCTEGDGALLSINRQRIAVDAAGGLAFAGVEVNAIDPHGERGGPLRALAARVLRAVPGLRGFVGIDLVWHPAAGPVVIEVNPRVTSAYVGLSAALGRNLAADLLDRALTSHAYA